MSDFKRVGIDVLENGYIVTVLLPIDYNGKKFIFNTVKKMKEWLNENLSATGEVERFSEALDDSPKDDISTDAFTNNITQNMSTTSSNV